MPPAVCDGRNLSPLSFYPYYLVAHHGDAGVNRPLLQFLVQSNPIHMQSPQFDVEGRAAEPWRRNIVLGAAVTRFQSHMPLPGRHLVFTSSSIGNPSAFNKSGADQSSDSPTAWRTDSAGSMQMTLNPALASCSDAAFPAKPPPMTITSDEVCDISPGGCAVAPRACSMAQAKSSVENE